MSHVIYLGLLLASSIHHNEGFYVRSALSGATDHVEEDEAKYNQFAYSLRGLRTTAESSLYYNKRDLEYGDDSVTPQATTNDIVKALDRPFGTSMRSSRNVRGDENPTTSQQNDGDFSNGDKGQLGISKEKPDTVATHLDKLPVRPPIQQTLDISPLPKQQPTTTFSKPDIFSTQQTPPSPQILNNSPFTTESELNKETDNSARPIKNGLDQRILTPNMKLLEDNNGFYHHTGEPDKIVASTTPYKDEGGDGNLRNVNKCCKKPTIDQLSSKITETMDNKPQYENEANGQRHHTIKNNIEPSKTNDNTEERSTSKDEPTPVNTAKDFIQDSEVPSVMHRIYSDIKPQQINNEQNTNTNNELSVASDMPNLEKLPELHSYEPNQDPIGENTSGVKLKLPNKKIQGRKKQPAKPNRPKDNIQEKKISEEGPTYKVTEKENIHDNEHPAIDPKTLIDMKPYQTNDEKETNTNTGGKIASPSPNLEKLLDSGIDEPNKNTYSENYLKETKHPTEKVDQKKSDESGDTSARANKEGKTELPDKPNKPNDIVKKTKVSDDKPTHKITENEIIQDTPAVDLNILSEIKPHQTNGGQDIKTRTVENVASAPPKLEKLPDSNINKPFIQDNTHPIVDPTILGDMKSHPKETKTKGEKVISSTPNLDKLPDSHIDEENKEAKSKEYSSKKSSPTETTDQQEHKEGIPANENKAGKEELPSKPKNLNDNIMKTQISDDNPTNKVISNEIIKDSENPAVGPNILNDMKQHQPNNGNDNTTKTVEKVASAALKLEILPDSHIDKPFKETLSEHYSGKDPPLKDQIDQPELDDVVNISANKNKAGKEEPSDKPIKLNNNIKEAKISKDEPTDKVIAKEIIKDSDDPAVDPKILSDKKPHPLNYETKETNANTEESITSAIPSLEKLPDSHIDKPNENNLSGHYLGESPSPKETIDKKEPYESGKTSANENKEGKEEPSGKPTKLNDNIKETKISKDEPTDKVIAKEIIKDGENPAVYPNILNDMKQHQTNNGNDITTKMVEKDASAAPKLEILPDSHIDKPFKETLSEHYSGETPPIKDQIDQTELDDAVNISANKNKAGKEEPSDKPIKLNNNIKEAKISKDEPTDKVIAKEIIKDSDDPAVDPKILSDKKTHPLNYETKETNANTEESITSAIPSLEKLPDSHIDKPNENNLSGHYLGESPSPKETIDKEEPYESGNTSANEHKEGKEEPSGKPTKLNDNIKGTKISKDEPTDKVIAKEIIKDSENPAVYPNILNDMKQHQTNNGNDITTKTVEKDASAVPKLEKLPDSHINEPNKEAFSEKPSQENSSHEEKIHPKELIESGDNLVNENKSGTENLQGKPDKPNENIKETKISGDEPTDQIIAKEIFKGSDNPALDPNILSDKKPHPLNYDKETNASTEESIASAISSLEKLPDSHIDKPNENTFSGHYLGEIASPNENIDQKEPHESGNTSENENKLGKEELPSKPNNLNDNIMKTQISDQPTNKVIAKEIIKDSENPAVGPNTLNDMKQHHTNNGNDITTKSVEKVASAAPKLEKLPNSHINEPNEEAFSENPSVENSSPAEKTHPKELVDSGDNLVNENKIGTEDLPGKPNKPNENIKETKISGDAPTLKVTAKEIFQGNENTAIVPKILTEKKPYPTIIDENETNVKTQESIASSTPSSDKLHLLNIDKQNQDIKGKFTVDATSFSPLKSNQKEGSKEEKPGKPNEPNGKIEGEKKNEEKPIHEVKSKEIFHLKETVLPEQNGDSSSDQENYKDAHHEKKIKNKAQPDSEIEDSDKTTTTDPRITYNKKREKTKPSEDDGTTNVGLGEEMIEQHAEKEKVEDDNLSEFDTRGQYEDFGEHLPEQSEEGQSENKSSLKYEGQYGGDDATHNKKHKKTTPSEDDGTTNVGLGEEMIEDHAEKEKVENNNLSELDTGGQYEDFGEHLPEQSEEGQSDKKSSLEYEGQYDSDDATHNKKHEKTKTSDDDGTTNVSSGEEIIEHHAEQEKVEEDNLPEFDTGGQYEDFDEHLPEESEAGQSDNKSSSEYEGQYDSDDGDSTDTFDEDGSDDFGEQSKEGLHKHQEEEENFEGQHGEIEDEEQEEAEEDISEYEYDGDENNDDERYNHEEYHDSKSGDEPLSNESEETRHLSQSQLKRFFMVERIKFLRLEQTLVEAKIKHELKSLENKN